MNKLPLRKRVMNLSLLVEGMSMRSIRRTAGFGINTVTKLLVDAGEACAAYHDQAVRAVKADRVQCGEIGAFCYAKQKNVNAAKAAPDEAGDVWMWTAIDAESKLIVSYLVGGRSQREVAGYGADLRVDRRTRSEARSARAIQEKYSKLTHYPEIRVLDRGVSPLILVESINRPRFDCSFGDWERCFFGPVNAHLEQKERAHVLVNR